MDEKFAVDRNLGKLVKWLRILGYDAQYDPGNADQNFLRRAAEEGRIALTRKRNLACRFRRAEVLVVKADRLASQIDEVLAALKSAPDPARRMTRCLICNEALENAAKETVAGMVPAFVFATCDRYRRCPRCGRIFWPGTHTRHVAEYLRERLPGGGLPPS